MMACTTGEQTLQAAEDIFMNGNGGSEFEALARIPHQGLHS